MIRSMAGAAALWLVAVPAIAADVPAPAPRLDNTITLEFSPEFYALGKPGAYEAGDLADVYGKISLSHAFDNDIVVGGSLQHAIRTSNPTSASSTYDQAELSLAYRWRLNDTFTLTPGVLLGEGFGDQPKIDPANPFASEAYYAVSLAGDMRLTSNLTWNVFNVRWRDAFAVTWRTPKVSTGMTYRVDPANAVYFNVGMSWKDAGTGYAADKVNLALGYKLSF
jgi:hypothetical protein